jgi:hypothetical protein
LQLLFYIEQMQIQLRAEAGIREIVIGYIGDPDVDTSVLDHDEITDLMQGLGSEAIQSAAEDLPDFAREMYLSEMHRMRTGEIRPLTDFEAVKQDG